MEEKVFAVFYTDGGCKPSRGIGGWGVHGYVFNNQIPKVGTGLQNWFITPSGYVDEKVQITNGEWLTKWKALKELAKDPKVKNVNVLQYVDMVGSLIPESTNNIAELTAMLKALEYVLNYKAKNPLLEEVTVITDSKYVQQGLESWLPKWIQNDWISTSGKPVANIELWKELNAVKETLEGLSIVLTLEWVKGHAGEQEGVERDNLGNALADEYASNGIVAGQNNVSVNLLKEKDAKGYWKPKNESNRMFNHSRWYFNTAYESCAKNELGYYTYYLGEHGTDDDFLGKRMSDATFSVIYTKEPEPVLEKIREHQNNVNVTRLNSFIIGRLDFIFKPSVYNTILEEGAIFLKKPSYRLDLFDSKNLQITKELRPARLAYNLIEVMFILEKLLKSKINDKFDKNIRLTEITDVIYEFTKKGQQKIRSELTTVVKSINVTVDSGLEPNVKIPLTFGIDIPSRNTLSALVDGKPKVFVITWPESMNAFRFATIVETSDDIGIFAGFYSNIHLLIK